MKLYFTKKIRSNLVISSLISALTFLMPATISFAQVPGDASNWLMVFQDEFNGTTLNNNEWSRIGNDLQLPLWQACRMNTFLAVPPYDDHNHIVSDGSLKLMVRKEDVLCTDYSDIIPGQFTQKLYHFSAGMIKSIKTFKYGYFEIRCKLPVIPNGKKGAPLGPNFWLYGGDNACGVNASEIDVFEYAYDGIPCIPPPPPFISCGTDDVESTVYPLNNYPHYKSNFHYTPVGQSVMDDNQDSRHYHTDATAYHTYGLEWDCDVFKFYFDGVLTYSKVFYNNNMVNMNLIVDINSPIAKDDNIGDDTYLPYTFEIDYVKVYKKILSPIPSSPLHSVINSPLNSRYAYGNLFYSIAGPSNGLTVKNNGALDVAAQLGISVSPPFIVEPGGFFRAQITYFDTICNSGGALFDPLTGHGYRVDGSYTDQSEMTEEINDITVSPNPSSGIFKILLSDSDDLVTSVDVVNSLGATIYSIKDISKDNQVDISSSKTGIYYLKVHYRSGRTKSKKIVLQ